MRRRLLVPGLLIAGLLVASPARAATITFESLSVSPNDVFTIGINITSVVDLYTFGFNVSFDPTVVSAPIVSRGNIFTGTDGECPIAFCFSPGLLLDDVLDEAGAPLGVVSVILDSLIGFAPGVSRSATAPPNAPFLNTLVFLTFQALPGGGDTGISISDVFLLDSIGGEIGDVIVSNGFVGVATAAAVPEPSTLGLFGLGLLVLARSLRRKKTPPS